MRRLFLTMLIAACFLSPRPAWSGADGKSPNSATGFDAPPAEPVPGLPKAPASSKVKRRSTSEASRKITVGDNPGVKSFSFIGRERATKPLVVRSREADPKTSAQLQEDLAVMARIIEKAAAEFKDDHEEAAGIPILALAGARNVRAMYLEEYGVVFTMSVNIPLRTEAKDTEPEAVADNATNEEWNEARNELFGDRRLHRVQRNVRQLLDPRQFEEFRDSLVDALKNAANIRHLRATDWVTLVVRGRGGEEEVDRQFDVFVQGKGGETALAAFPAGDERAAENSTMVLRVKKSDIDQAGNQAGSLDALRKKVTLSLY